MQIRYITTILLILYGHMASGQLYDMFKEDLDQEMGYKIKNSDAKDRGVDLFRQEMDKLLQNSKAFPKSESFLGSVILDIEFVGDTAVVQNQKWHFNFRDKTLSPEVKEAEIKRIIEELLPGWHPAIYQGLPIKKSYYAIMRIKSESNTPTSIEHIDIEPTTTKTKFGSDCFQLYNLERDSSMLKYLFTAAPIMSEYQRGKDKLIQDINILLDTTFFSFSIDNHVKDSCIMDFIINIDGKLGQMNTYVSQNDREQSILTQIKRLSCNWLPAISSGRTLNMIVKYKFIYSYVPVQTSNRKNPYLIRVDSIEVRRGEPIRFN